MPDLNNSDQNEDSRYNNTGSNSNNNINGYTNGNVNDNRNSYTNGSMNDNRNSYTNGSINDNGNSYTNGSANDNRNSYINGSANDNRNSYTNGSVNDNRNSYMNGSTNDNRTSNMNGNINDNINSYTNGSTNGYMNSNMNSYANNNNSGMNGYTNNNANSNAGSGNNQNQYNRVPEYSFWAEQMPGSSYYNNNQGNNSWQYSNSMYNMNNSNNMKQSDKKKKGGNKAVRLITRAVCFGLIAGLSFIGLQALVNVVSPGVSTIGLLTAAVDSVSENHYQIGYTKTSGVKTRDRTAISAVTDSVKPSIVSINCKATQALQDWFGQQINQDVESSGSGIIVGENDKELLVATNNHVVEGAATITVTFTDGTVADAEIKGTDSTADLAVVTVDISKIKEDTLDKISVAKLGNSDKVKVGEMSIAIGNALGYGQSVTVGYISAKDRDVEVSDGNASKNMTFLQTDAAINPGNSGGALINVDGEVIGINTVKYASEEVEGMGYAIPISKATPIINELMNREILSEEEQGYLGITGYDVTEDDSKRYNIPIGVYIDTVSKDAAADKAGIKPEDIITKVNDAEITSFTQLKDKVNSLKVGTEIEVTYMRNTDGKYKESKVKVTLGKNPSLNN